MKAYLVDVNWAMLFWMGMLLLNLIVVTISTILDCKVRREIVKQNQLIMEQNRSLKTVIVRVCSKSVRDRKEAQKEEQNEEIKE